jgi:hypothetical protein
MRNASGSIVDILREVLSSKADFNGKAKAAERDM